LDIVLLGQGAQAGAEAACFEGGPAKRTSVLSQRARPVSHEGRRSFAESPCIVDNSPGFSQSRRCNRRRTTVRTVRRGATPALMMTTTWSQDPATMRIPR
jgi:hypothetical protein